MFVNIDDTDIEFEFDVCEETVEKIIKELTVHQKELGIDMEKHSQVLCSKMENIVNKIVAGGGGIDIKIGKFDIMKKYVKRAEKEVVALLSIEL